MANWTSTTSRETEVWVMDDLNKRIVAEGARQATKLVSEVGQCLLTQSKWTKKQLSETLLLMKRVGNRSVNVLRP